MEKGIVRGAAIGLAVGAAVGAGLGILYAPQSGKKTRKEIMERAEDFSESVKKRAEDISDAVTDNAHKYRKKMMEAVS